MATVPPTESIEPGKLFVGGLSWETTKDKLSAYFKQYGDVTDCVVMKDPNSQKPRGFGFVTYADPSSVDTVLASGPHTLDEKNIDPKQATVKGNQQGMPIGGSKETTKKIFLGGIHPETKVDTIQNYFSSYGTIKNVDLKYDKATNKMRGFGFVEFESEEVVKNVVATHYHTIDGKQVEAKKAEPRFSAGNSFDRGPGQQYSGVQHGGQYPNGYGQQGTAQHYPTGAAYTTSYGQSVYGNFQPQYYPQQYNPRQYGTNQSYGNSYASGNYRSFDSAGYGGGQQTTGAAAGQMYGQVEQASYPTTARSGYSSTTDGYNSQSSYGYDAYPQTYQQQDTSQRGAGSYGRGSQPQQQSSYYSGR